MDSRRVLATWLEGPRAAAQAAGVELGYRGERLGLPQDGSGSLAGPGRRVGALVADWAAAMLVAALAVPYGSSAHNVLTYAVFLVEVAVLTATIGASFGQRLLGLHVVRLGAARGAGPVRALVRTLLLALVVPALVWDRDGRGLHDKATGTAVLRR